MLAENSDRVGHRFPESKSVRSYEVGNQRTIRMIAAPIRSFSRLSFEKMTTAAIAATSGEIAAASTDVGSAFKLLLSCPSGLPRSRVYVDFSESHDRIPHPDPKMEESINEIWNRRIQENPSLYNGTKFRYGGHALRSLDGLEQDFSICLHLGLTDYRTFVGTNLNPLWEKFLVPSEDDSIRCQHTSSPLGNGAVVETIDKKILVLQRSYNVGEFPGYFVFPGGHSEPQEIGISSHQTSSDLSESGQLNDKVSEEMFDGMIREVVEEIGAPAQSLVKSPPYIVTFQFAAVPTQLSLFHYHTQISMLYAGRNQYIESIT